MKIASKTCFPLKTVWEIKLQWCSENIYKLAEVTLRQIHCAVQTESLSERNEIEMTERCFYRRNLLIRKISVILCMNNGEEREIVFRGIYLNLTNKTYSWFSLLRHSQSFLGKD